MRTLLFVSLTLIVFAFNAPAAHAGEGWCGGTSTSTCCENLGNKGSCSCVCIPGNCYCGPRLSAGGGSSSAGMSLPVTVVDVENGRETRKMTRRLSVPTQPTRMRAR